MNGLANAAVRKLALTVVFLVVLTRCGIAAEPQETYFLQPGDVVLMLGDSITADTGYCWFIFYEDLKKRYPELVMRGDKPGADFTGPGIRFINGGVSGDTAGGGLTRLPGLLARHRPTVAVVCFGMNDRYKDRRNYVANMKGIVKKLRDASIPTTLLTSPCVCTVKHPELKPYVDVLGEMADEVKQIAEAEGVLFADCYTPTKKYMEDTRKDFTWGDGIHPNHEGRRIMADALEGAWGLGKPLAAKGTPRRGQKPGTKPEPARAATWTNVTGNVGGEKWGYAGVCTMAAVPSSGEIIAGISEAGLWSSIDGGANWKKLGADDKERITCRPYQIVFDPKDPKTFWLSGNYGPGIFKTTDGGKSFRRLGNLSHVDGLAVDFTDPDRTTLLVGLHEQERSLHRSVDGGATWQKIGDKLPENTNFTSDVIVLDAKTYIVNTAGWKQGRSWGIYRTEDAGETWTKVSDAGPNGVPLVVSDASIYWQALWGQGLVKSIDKGKTWAKLPGPVKANPIEMPGGKLVAPVERQLFASADGGRTWEKLCDPMPFKPSGVVYSDKRRCFYIWRSSDKKLPDAIFRLDLAEGAGGPNAPARMIVWDGDTVAGGGGWTHPKTDALLVKPQDAEFHNGKTALEFHAEGTVWLGCGWNWCGWYPENAGTDISAFRNLSFWVKLKAEKKPSNFQVHLSCSSSKKPSRDVDVPKYCPNVMDGDWHEVVIPLKDLYDDNSEFDPKKAWELDLGCHTTEEAGFSIFVDEIGFDDRDAAPAAR